MTSPKRLRQTSVLPHAMIRARLRSLTNSPIIHGRTTYRISTSTGSNGSVLMQSLKWSHLPLKSSFSTLGSQHVTRQASILTSLNSTRISLLPLPISSSNFAPTLLVVSRRTLHCTSRREDVFFVAFPALKAQLLNLTRICLVALPFVYRYR